MSLEVVGRIGWSSVAPPWPTLRRVTVVSAPASSANLGPGFDVLGLALDLRVRVADEPFAPESSAQASPQPSPQRLPQQSCGPDHIARIAYEAAGGDGPIWFDFDVPAGRGLGFSAAARAAGAALALAQSGETHDEMQRRAYDVVFDLEGHGDNAAPAVFGGIHVIAGDVHHRLDATFPADLVVWVPHEATTSTDKSRSAMGDTVGLDDAVFNLGRVALLVAAIHEQRPELLRHATADRLHQPGRLAVATESAATLEAGLAAGALAGWLSGSGPSIAFAVESACVGEVIEALPESGDIYPLPVDQRGAVVETD